VKIIYCGNSHNDSKVTRKIAKMCGYDSCGVFCLPDVVRSILQDIVSWLTLQLRIMMPRMVQWHTHRTEGQNTHLFYDSGYDDTIKPYDIDTYVKTILINAARIQASCIPLECWNQISNDGHTIWTQIPNEDHTIILEGCPDDTVSGLMDLMSPSSFPRQTPSFPA
jgi:hypothetical protein